MDGFSLTSPLALGLLGLGALLLAAVLLKLPIPYREKRMAVGAILVLAGAIPISCGFCGMCLVGFAWQSGVSLGVVVAIGLAAVWLGGRLFLSGIRYREEPALPQVDAQPPPPTEPTD